MHFSWPEPTLNPTLHLAAIVLRHLPSGTVPEDFLSFPECGPFEEYSVCRAVSLLVLL